MWKVWIRKELTEKRIKEKSYHYEKERSQLLRLPFVKVFRRRFKWKKKKRSQDQGLKEEIHIKTSPDKSSDRLKKNGEELTISNQSHLLLIFSFEISSFIYLSIILIFWFGVLLVFGWNFIWSFFSLLS